MSYPEPRYTASTGAPTAVLRPAGSAVDLRLRTTSVRYLATGASTDGAFGLYRWDMAADRGGATPHFHRGMTESFYVLAGAVRLYDGVRWLDAAVGDFLHVPPGGVHGFANESGAPTSMLILFTPGAPRERYFEALAELAASGRDLTPEAWTAFLAEHDQYEA